MKQIGVVVLYFICIFISATATYAEGVVSLHRMVIHNYFNRLDPLELLHATDKDSGGVFIYIFIIFIIRVTATYALGEALL